MLEREITVVLFCFYFLFSFSVIFKTDEQQVESVRKGQARVLSISAYSQGFFIFVSNQSTLLFH